MRVIYGPKIKKLLFIAFISVFYLVITENYQNLRTSFEKDQLDRISDFYEDAENDVLDSKFTQTERKLPWNIWIRIYGENYINDKSLKPFQDEFEKHKFNQSASEEIGYIRELPKAQSFECKKELENRYDSDAFQNLPETSIIFTYHNEARSTLLRSIISVFARSPYDLIKEIILVDDGSDDDSDGKELERIEKVKLIRNFERFGLVKSRLIGAKEATGDVLTFLDSHIECNEYWLEPLLYEIFKNDTNIVSPVIDRIDKNDFTYRFTSDSLKAGFSYGLQLEWFEMDRDEETFHQSHPTSPISTPIIAGGLFSIDREYFWYLGAYDSQMTQWGGENLEISLRQWMCGGKLEILPCSRVGHVFRSEYPYEVTAEAFYKNTNRVAEVWLNEEFKEKYYATVPYAKSVDSGDVNERLDLQQKLHCENFDWYVENVYPELRYPVERYE